MNTNYEVRAMKFAKALTMLFKDCMSLADFKRAIKTYNENHRYPLHWDNGISRIAIIRSDYVIKFNYGYNHDFGDCLSERMAYELAEKDGMSHLLAKTTIVSFNGCSCAIMPRIKRINNDHRYWEEHCSSEECEWLYNHVRDLHSGNVGYRNGKVCVIDYAASRDFSSESSDSHDSIPWDTLPSWSDSWNRSKGSWEDSNCELESY